MSLGRHAYRHASASSSPLIGDHVWISEDFLATTFRCFADGQRQQRRYESRAPGPLEAKRRLAKRRNTSLASVAGSGQWGDIACLFGKNGKEHMNWTDRRAQMQDRGMQSYPFGPEVPPFYNKNNGELSSWPAGLVDDRATREQYLAEYLESNWTPAAIEEIVSRLNINLQQEPEYSRKICNLLLAKSVHDRAADEALFLFLDDLTLNIRGSGNYAAAVEYLAWNKTRPRSRLNCLRAVVKALKSGSVLPDELRVIVRTIPRVQFGSDMDKQSHSKDMVNWYRLMWDAIGHCDVFGHRDLDLKTIGMWLGILQRQDSLEAMDLAKDIILVTQNPADCTWIPVFIIRWLNLAIELRATSEDYVSNILCHLDPDIGSSYIADITETLASLVKGGRRTLLLEKWRDCLSAFSDTKPLVLSPAWAKMDSPRTISRISVVLGESTGFQKAIESSYGFGLSGL